MITDILSSAKGRFSLLLRFRLRSSRSGRFCENPLPSSKVAADYSGEDVYKILNKDVKRKTVLYARVSTSKQKNDLQLSLLIMYILCVYNAIVIIDYISF